MKEIIPVISVSEEGTVRDALKALDKGGVGVVLLIGNDSGKFLGLITDGDVRRALLSGIGLESAAKSIKRPVTQTATVNMTTEKIAAMFSEPIRAVPILDDAGKVVDLAIFDSRASLPVAAPTFGESELKYVNECVLTGWVSSAGSFVKKFEDQFAEFCSSKYAVSTSSGTTALHLALLVAGVGPGDEVIVPSLTFIATANAVMFAGAKPVLVDSESETWNINPEEIKKAITPKTKAIIPVHLYGHPADMDPILDIANQNNIMVIEDAAEAHGAEYKGKRVGSIGSMGVFSFFGNKIITTGEGGMIVTDDSELAGKLRILRDHGMDPKKRYYHTVLGFNYRLTNIQAALGVGQMERIHNIIDRKRKNASCYKKGLSSVKGITLPGETTWAKNVFWLYSILVDSNEFGITSGELAEELRKNEIDTRPLFIPIHKQPIYNTSQQLPVSERLSVEGLSLPSSVNLNYQEIERITSEIKNLGNFYD